MSAPRRPSRRRAPVHDDEHEANHERWLLTYADMITLLMVLFIVLFAISVVDKKKFAELADGLSHQFGASTKVLPDGTGVLDGGKTANADLGQLANNPNQPIVPINQADVDVRPGTAQQTDTSQQTSNTQQPGASPQSSVAQATTSQQRISAEKAALADAAQRISAALKQQGLQNSAHLSIDGRGLVVSIVTDQVLFDTGEADLKPIGDRVLDAIGPTLATLPNDISVEGHTDNVPINGGPFPSNWELSAVRATTVLRYLVANDGLQANRMSATGYAETRPVAPNDTVAHRSLNRRVDVVVLSTVLTTDLPAAESAP